MHSHTWRRERRAHVLGQVVKPNITEALGLRHSFDQNLRPAIAYAFAITRRTGSFDGLNESRFASNLAGIVYSLLSAPLLIILRITGLIPLFNYTSRSTYLAKYALLQQAL